MFSFPPTFATPCLPQNYDCLLPSRLLLRRLKSFMIAYFPGPCGFSIIPLLAMCSSDNPSRVGASSQQEVQLADTALETGLAQALICTSWIKSHSLSKTEEG